MGLGLISLASITLEATTRYLEPVRGTLRVAIAPLQVVAELPYMAADSLGGVVAARTTLVDQNRDLQRRIMELSQLTQQYPALKAENQRLRTLLDSRARVSMGVLVAEVVGVVPSPNTHQIVLDRGEDGGVTVGQAVIDAEGLFGQVVEVGPVTSRVLLLSDRDHAVPVEVVRNGVRSIAAGTGEPGGLRLEHVPVTADVREGDLLVSSGLGGHFPKGYPVGDVASVIVEPTAAFAEVIVVPNAALDRARELMVVFDQTPGEPGDQGEPGSAPDVGPEASPQPDRGEASAPAPVESNAAEVLPEVEGET